MAEPALVPLESSPTPAMDTYPSALATRPSQSLLSPDSTVPPPQPHYAIIRSLGGEAMRVDNFPAVWSMSETHLLFVSNDQYTVARPVGDVGEFRRPLVERIIELIGFAKEDDEQQAPRQRSLEGFVKLLYVHQDRIKTRPQLVLTLDGHLRAVWRRSKDHRIAMRFIDDKNVAFVTFLPDSFRPSRTNHIGGESSIEAVFETIGLKEI